MPFTGYSLPSILASQLVPVGVDMLSPIARTLPGAGEPGGVYIEVLNTPETGGRIGAGRPLGNPGDIRGGADAGGYADRCSPGLRDAAADGFQQFGCGLYRVLRGKVFVQHQHRHRRINLLHRLLGRYAEHGLQVCAQHDQPGLWSPATESARRECCRWRRRTSRAEILFCPVESSSSTPFQDDLVTEDLPRGAPLPFVESKVFSEKTGWRFVLTSHRS